MKIAESQLWQEEWGRGDEQLYSPAVLQVAVCSARVSAAAGSDAQLISRLTHHCSHFLIFMAPEVHLGLVYLYLFFLNNVSALLLWI